MRFTSPFPLAGDMEQDVETSRKMPQHLCGLSGPDQDMWPGGVTGIPLRGRQGRCQGRARVARTWREGQGAEPPGGPEPADEFCSDRSGRLFVSRVFLGPKIVAKIVLRRG